MYIDKLMQYSDAQGPITASAASTKVLNQAKAGGPHEKAYLFVKCDVAFDNLTSLDIAFQTSDDNFSADTTEVFTVSFLLAELTLDAVLIKLDVPMNLKQYTRMYYTVVGTAPTAGSLTAEIVPDIENYHEVS